jgi:hypothetical protein
MVKITKYRVEWWLPGAGEEMELLPNGHEVSVVKRISSRDLYKIKQVVHTALYT